MADERIWELMARKLASEASSIELDELEQLLRTRPDLHPSIQTVTDLWHHEGAPGNEILLQQAYQQHIDRMQQMGIPITPYTPENPLLLTGSRNRSRVKYTWMAIAATVIILASAAKFFYGPLSTSPKATAHTGNPLNEITTKNGSKTRIQLPDGTQVWLNAGSKLTYEKNFGNTLREVTLSGEGFFEVVRNEHKPFIIHTTKMDVKVLGTSFNVKSYPNDKTTEAALIHGSIEVSLRDRPVEKIILKPNEKIVVANTDTQAVKTTPKTVKQDSQESLVAIKNLTYERSDSAIIETSWVDNRLIFVDESFRDLALRLERWYGVSFNFESRKAAALRFTGSFKDESIEDVMWALRVTAHFSYKIQGKVVTISYNDY